MVKSKAVEPLTLAWDDISVVPKKSIDLLDKFRGNHPSKRIILQGVSGIIEPGTLTALMGPSGAGKTTLMNVLTQRNLAGLEIEGNVMLNGVPTNKISSFNKMVGFIQQFDMLPGALTVREHLSFTVSLLYQKSMTSKQREAKVDAAITQVSLNKCADSLIGWKMMSERISGGERKRVSIATQLLNDPSVIILDEPTTGLDSFLASLLVKILHDLANRGYTILCTIHQPSSQVFLEFDRLALIADGRSAYIGSRQKAVDYFGRLGFKCPATFLSADYFIDILTRKPNQENKTIKNIQFLCNRFEQSAESALLTDQLNNEACRRKSENNMIFTSATKQVKMTEASVITQFLLLLVREYKGLIRPPERLLKKTFTMMFTTILFLGILWNPNGAVNQRFVNNSFGAIALIIGTLGGGLTLTGIIPNMVEMLPLVFKECRDGLYNAIAFYAASILTEIVLVNLLLSMSFLPIYYGSGLYQTQNDFSTALEMILICILMSFIIIGFASILIFIGEKTEVCVELFSTTFTCFTVLNGYFVNLRTIESPFLKAVLYLNWIPWSLEWAQGIQWKHVNIECEYTGTELEGICLHTGEAVIYKLGFEDQKRKDILVLIGQMISYQLIAVGLILFKMRRFN